MLKRLITIQFIVILTIIFISNTFSYNRERKRKYELNRIIGHINIGVKDTIKNIDYATFVEVNRILRNQPYKTNSNYIQGMAESNFANGLRVFGGGLYNPDPRVRLICIDILKYFPLQKRHLKAIDQMIDRYSEGRRRNYFPRSEYVEYEDFFGFTKRKHPVKELINLKKWIIRRELVQRIYNEDPHVLEDIDKYDFSVLIEPIEGEDVKKVPLLSDILGKRLYFNSVDVPIFINGLKKNRVLSVREGCATFLIAFYNRNLGRMDEFLRRDILKALRNAYDNGVIPKPKLKDRPKIFKKGYVPKKSRGY